MTGPGVTATRMGRTAVTGAELAARTAEVVAALTRIPWSVRRFAVPAASVATTYRLDRTVLDMATRAGLPCIGTADDALYDMHDLTNLALYLPMRTPHRAAMRFWAQVLDRPDGEQRTYRITYRTACPAPGHGGPCVITFHLPDGTAVTVPAEDGRPVEHTVDVVLRNDWPALPAPLADLAEEMSAIQFFRLPDAIRWDVDFSTANLVADCAGIARLLANGAMERGWQSRVRYGLIVAPPFSMPHFWAEFRIDGQWVPCDPGLINGMVRWGVLPAGRWTPDRSLGGLLAGISSHYRMAALHNGFPIDSSFPTHQVQRPDGVRP
ncbi:hypothetical protein I0C86_28205 [Plantactinospora sp. S1510]|uniref:Transglutaminase-like domain-containing protein n=1 Tax=Plantactinospora alkalitolerans TaxID=2789879 RepID=A0ABS0H2W4_9ACTN|nr:hypothetical protein [Plantactinospora alkalitolerans]MBF9132810.1 hypothetical protein [Plantactinospora alkalitolerans]